MYWAAPGGEGRAILPAAATCPHVVEYAGAKVASVANGTRAAARRANPPDVTPNIPRHTAAAGIALADVPMIEIARLPGPRDSRIAEPLHAKYSPDYPRRAVSTLSVQAWWSGNGPECRTPGTHAIDSSAAAKAVRHSNVTNTHEHAGQGGRAQIMLLTGPERRRRWSNIERWRIGMAAFTPGAAVANGQSGWRSYASCGKDGLSERDCLTGRGRCGQPERNPEPQEAKPVTSTGKSGPLDQGIAPCPHRQPEPHPSMVPLM